MSRLTRNTLAILTVEQVNSKVLFGKGIFFYMDIQRGYNREPGASGPLDPLPPTSLE